MLDTGMPFISASVESLDDDNELKTVKSMLHAVS